MDRREQVPRRRAGHLGRVFATLTVAAAAAAALAGPAVAAGSEHASSDAMATRPIRVVHSHKCMGVAGGSTANNAPVIQYSCNAARSQSWSLNGNEQIVNDYTHKCLDVRGHSAANGAKIVQYTCGGATKGNQKFRFETRNPTPFTTGATLFNKCLEVPRSSRADGVQLQQFTCNRGANQLFSFHLPGP